MMPRVTLIMESVDAHLFAFPGYAHGVVIDGDAVYIFSRHESDDPAGPQERCGKQPWGMVMSTKIKACILLILVSGYGTACAQSEHVGLSDNQDLLGQKTLECPRDLPLVRDRLERYLLIENENGMDSVVEMREKFSSPEQILVLNDREDASICRSLNEYFTPTLATKNYSDEHGEFYDADALYYKGQGYYFAVVVVNTFPRVCYQEKVSKDSGCTMVAVNVYNEDMEGIFMAGLDY